MLWTWVLVCILIGEIALYAILATSRARLPYEIVSPVRTKVFFYVLCFFLFIVGGISFFSFREIQGRLTELDLISARFMAIGAIETSVLRMESTQRGFLLTGRDVFLEPYYRHKESIPGKCDELKRLYSGTVDANRINELCILITNKLVTLEKNIEIKKSGQKNELEEALLFSEGKNTMEAVVLMGRDLEDRDIADYRKIMAGLWALGSVRVYMSFTLMIAALVQMALAAILGRSQTPLPSDGHVGGEAFLP
jgi:CHASE3 domain sensor protein